MFISRCLEREERGGAGSGGGAAGPGSLISFLFGGPAKWEEGGGILNHGRGGAGVFMDLPGGWAWMLQEEKKKIVEGLGR